MMLNTCIPESLVPRQLSAVPWDKEPVTDSECIHAFSAGRMIQLHWKGAMAMPGAVVLVISKLLCALCSSIRAQGLGNTVTGVS